MSQQLVPPPCTGGHADWHCESDVQLPQVPPLPPLLLPLPELLLEVPLLLPEEPLLPLLPPLPELLVEPPLLDPLLLLLTPLLLPELPELLPLLLPEASLLASPVSQGLLPDPESPPPHAAMLTAKETATALNVASFMNAFLH